MILHFNTVLIFLGCFIVVTSIKVDLKKCQKKNGLFPKPGSLCKTYYKCTNWVPVEWMCPPDQHFNTIKKECDWINRFPCFEKPPSKECPRANGRFLKPGTSCVYFYDCCNGKPTEKKCPQNQIFDPEQEKCEWKEHYICIEDVSTDDSKTSLLFTTLETSTLNEVSTRENENYFTESSKNPPFSTTPSDSSTVSDFDQTTTDVFETTNSPVSGSVFTLIQTTSKEPFSPTYENDFSDTQEITAVETLSTANTSPESFSEETTDKETFQSTTLIEETASDKIILTTTLIKETTPEEVLQSTITIRKTTQEEIEQFSTTLIKEITPGEITQSTTSNRETISEEINQPTVEFKETTPEEILLFSSTPIRETTPDEIAQSTSSNRDTISEEINQSTAKFEETTPEEILQFSSTPIRETTPDEMARSTSSNRETMSEEIVQTTTVLKESTPDEITQSTISIRETIPEEIAQSSTVFRETTSEEISQSITSIIETTTEKIESTTGKLDNRITMTDIVFLSTSEDVLQTTDEPNIFCPQPDGYFPHPTNKHKFIGCVDNIAHVLTCPHDLIYDDNYRQCIYED